MSTTFGRYVIGAEVLAPTGMNIDLALSVAKANLGRFSQKSSDDQLHRFLYATADYLKETGYTERLCEMISTLAEKLLAPLTASIKPLPVVVSVPEHVDTSLLMRLLREHPVSKYLSTLEISSQQGAGFVLEALQSLDVHDVVLCIAVDSLVANLDNYIADFNVLCSANPWGIIPSEGGAGVVLTKKNIVDTLKLKPHAQVAYFDIEKGASDRRGMMRLVQKATKTQPKLGKVYTNMTNARDNTEDYGFALGARSAVFTHPQMPFLVNDLWGTMGGGSAMSLIAVFIAEQKETEIASLLMYELNGDRAVLCLYKHFD
ncbi:hypothetical protein [Enterovibrio nigricans]|uniref:3-oxoacyl-[acyl-carrier-protein] synthase-1 n=1 Tax=Enterovibrio nigricans DSM 22720 TaxID=1121868 RepID=A0A1T4VAB1_9GAMM|nr:hypothetical protein [Enterovibrio nigricans]PKF50035.1 hypothetical protein AT251_14470 [Enterovibrio nigricans]SKA61868.1 hypothetical protein SAMN02745132_03539 [Enterovibrio nigricans DSM 22720]